MILRAQTKAITPPITENSRKSLNHLVVVCHKRIANSWSCYSLAPILMDLLRSNSNLLQTKPTCPRGGREGGEGGGGGIPYEKVGDARRQFLF